MIIDKHRILLVDDDHGLLRLLSIRLSAAGYEVEAVQSGELALEVMPVFRPHLVITDMKMGGMDGMTLFSNIHNRHASLPVIILTAHGTSADALEASRRGVSGYMIKPFDSKILLHLVAQVLQGGEPSSGIDEIDMVRAMP